ncbi:MAG: hypothetical protein K2N61_13205 [Lachnospiraceae bacterium]|nr:hypothetical protein [Lachnospiraceae bacterium]
MITYQSICKKLGFDLKDYQVKSIKTEDDSIESPFRKLTLKEMEFLEENGYIGQQHKHL